MSDQDSEITLGTGRLLGLFFGLVILCALFFSVGFSLGRKSIGSQIASVLPVPTAAASAPKPSPSKPDGKPADCATPGNCPQQPASGSTSDELTFYKAVEQNDAKPQLQPAASAANPAEQSKLPEVSAANAIAAGYMVQVAAVSKQEDADALVNALRKKSYPVITTSNTDKLFHVQVGPFADAKDAEATRAKLISDGYNPILKK